MSTPGRASSTSEELTPRQVAAIKKAGGRCWGKNKSGERCKSTINYPFENHKQNLWAPEYDPSSPALPQGANIAMDSENDEDEQPLFMSDSPIPENITQLTPAPASQSELNKANLGGGNSPTPPAEFRKLGNLIFFERGSPVARNKRFRNSDPDYVYFKYSPDQSEEQSNPSTRRDTAEDRGEVSREIKSEQLRS